MSTTSYLLVTKYDSTPWVEYCVRLSARTLLIFGCAFAQLMFAAPSNAQGSGQVISGASQDPQYETPDPGLSPPPGNGMYPIGTPVGTLSAPTLLPWVGNTPTDQFGQTNSMVDFPADNSVLAEPGELGQVLAPYIPPPPSVLGSNPGSLTSSAGAIVQVNPGGGLPDGYAPTQRRSAQSTKDFGLTRTARAALMAGSSTQNPPPANYSAGSQLTDFGQPLLQKPNLAKIPNVSDDDPRATIVDQNLVSTRSPNIPNAQATTDLYGQRTFFKGNGVYPQAIQADY